MRDFLGLLKFQIFFGVLEIPDIFGGCRGEAGPETRFEGKKMRVPPPPPGICHSITNFVTLSLPTFFVQKMSSVLAPYEKKLNRENVLLFLAISLNMCFGCSKEPS